jgi:hypothetical protein
MNSAVKEPETTVSPLIITPPDQILGNLDLLLNNQLLLVPKLYPIDVDQKLQWFYQNPNKLPLDFTTTQLILKQSDQKKWALGVISSKFIDLVPDRLLNLIQTTSDELIMNAFFDAPVENGVVLYKNTPRTALIKRPKPVEVILGESATEVAVSVTDFYGSVNAHSIVKHIKKTFQLENYTAPKGEGAGLGLSMSVKRNTSLFIKVQEGVSSQFVVVFPKVENYKTYLEKSQLIGLISTK